MSTITEPSLDFQTAIRAVLIASPMVTALVHPTAIRSGGSLPHVFPCIRLANASTEYLGRASGGQLCARVSIDLHIWAADDGSDTGRPLGYKIVGALLGLDDLQPGFEIDELDFPRMMWLRDVQAENSFEHGIMTLEAVVRWRE